MAYNTMIREFRREMKNVDAVVVVTFLLLLFMFLPLGNEITLFVRNLFSCFLEGEFMKNRWKLKRHISKQK